MPADHAWHTRMHELRAAGQRVVPIDQPDILAALAPFASADLRRALSAFVDQWTRAPLESWQAWSAVVLALRPDLSDDDLGTPVAQSLRRLVDAAVHAAIVVENTGAAEPQYRCSVALQLRSRDQDDPDGTLRLHLPAEPRAIAGAEQHLGMILPPSYRALLNLTNGLGLDALDISCISGVGLDTAAEDHEIPTQPASTSRATDLVASWRTFQATYAYERQRDAAEGVTTFLSDERSLVPFMTTLFGDFWCFDVTRQGTSGECPIMFWDHEGRESLEEDLTFAEWLDHNLDREVYGEGE